MAPYFPHVINVLCENPFLCYGNFESCWLSSQEGRWHTALLQLGKPICAPVNQPCKHCSNKSRAWGTWESVSTIARKWILAEILSNRTSAVLLLQPEETRLMKARSVACIGDSQETNRSTQGPVDGFVVSCAFDWCKEVAGEKKARAPDVRRDQQTSTFLVTWRRQFQQVQLFKQGKQRPDTSDIQ